MAFSRLFGKRKEASSPTTDHLETTEKDDAVIVSGDDCLINDDEWSQYIVCRHPRHGLAAVPQCEAGPGDPWPDRPPLPAAGQSGPQPGPGAAPGPQHQTGLGGLDSAPGNQLHTQQQVSIGSESSFLQWPQRQSLVYILHSHSRWILELTINDQRMAWGLRSFFVGSLNQSTWLSIRKLQYPKSN